MSLELNLVSNVVAGSALKLLRTQPRDQQIRILEFLLKNVLADRDTKPALRLVEDPHAF